MIHSLLIVVCISAMFALIIFVWKRMTKTKQTINEEDDVFKVMKIKLYNDILSNVFFDMIEEGNVSNIINVKQTISGIILNAFEDIRAKQSIYILAFINNDAVTRASINAIVQKIEWALVTVIKQDKVDDNNKKLIQIEIIDALESFIEKLNFLHSKITDKQDNINKQEEICLSHSKNKHQKTVTFSRILET